MQIFQPKFKIWLTNNALVTSSSRCQIGTSKASRIRFRTFLQVFADVLIIIILRIKIRTIVNTYGTMSVTIFQTWNTRTSVCRITHEEGFTFFTLCALKSNKNMLVNAIAIYQNGWAHSPSCYYGIISTYPICRDPHN